MKHLITWADYSEESIRRILEIAGDLKNLVREGNRPAVLERRVVGLLFEKPSLRTRVSFECLAAQTGGASLFLGDDVGWGKREPVQDFIPILTSYIDCLVIRAKSHEAVIEASKYSRCPIINGLTDFSHPCQALADILTIEELFDGKKENLKIAYVGDANNVAYSLALLAGKLGIHFSIAAPEGYGFDSGATKRIASASSSTDLFEQFTDPTTAVKNADVIYTDVWTSMGQEAESAKRLKDFAGYQVNREMFSHANPDAKFMHCLPARRGEEVAADVIDSELSATVQQAENRLHAQKGLVVWMLTEAQHNERDA